MITAAAEAKGHQEKIPWEGEFRTTVNNLSSITSEYSSQRKHQAVNDSGRAETLSKRQKETARPGISVDSRLSFVQELYDQQPVLLSFSYDGC